MEADFTHLVTAKHGGAEENNAYLIGLMLQIKGHSQIASFKHHSINIYYETKNLHTQNIHNYTVFSPTCFGYRLPFSGSNTNI
jgi:hypothetical protein